MRQTVAIIDDDPNDLELMEEALTDLAPSAEIVSFEDCVEAYDKISKGAGVTIIFVDINMPLMRGDECLSLLHAQPRFNRVTIAIISTSMPESQREYLLEKGTSYVFQKPSRIEDLRTIIARVVKPG
jgi:CheY-like chemotaxis protein